jgi:hypothetical protein
MRLRERASGRKSYFQRLAGGLAGLLLLTGCQLTLEDFQDVVTKVDRGFNDFSGSVGDINKDGIDYGESTLVCAEGQGCRLRFGWDFSQGDD